MPRSRPLFCLMYLENRSEIVTQINLLHQPVSYCHFCIIISILTVSGPNFFATHKLNHHNLFFIHCHGRSINFENCQRSWKSKTTLGFSYGTCNAEEPLALALVTQMVCMDEVQGWVKDMERSMAGVVTHISASK